MSERKPRKPLIEPGSVLGGGDIMSSVLNNYAERTGTPIAERPAAEAPISHDDTPTKQGAEEVPPTPPAAEVSASDGSEGSVQQASGTASHTTIQPDIQTARYTDSKPAVQQASKPKRVAGAHRPARGADVRSVEDEVRERTDTPKRLCSYRIPEGIDDWLATYVYEHRATKVTKQDLVTEAIGLLIAAKAGARVVAEADTAGED